MYMYIRKFISAILDIGSTEKIVHVHQYQKIQEKQLFSNTISSWKLSIISAEINHIHLLGKN